MKRFFTADPALRTITRGNYCVLPRLVAAAKVTGVVAVNRNVQEVNPQFARLRPDIVICDDAQGKIRIIDVAVPFENRVTAFDDAVDEKLSKYHPLAENLRRNGYEAVVDAFLFGALGTWDPAN